jgi:hypothetical protein
MDYVINSLKPKSEREMKDRRRVEAKRKMWRELKDTLFL